MLDRTTTSFGLSIGTGLLLESALEPTESRYDDKRDIPVRINLNDYKKHYFNIFTIARNIVSAISDKRVKDGLMNNSKLMETVIEEINLIAMLYQDVSCTPVLFVPDYSKLYKDMNIGKEATLSSKDYLLQQYILSSIKNKTYDVHTEVLHGTYKLKPDSGAVLITTHIPVDLLNVNKIPNLKLLESHTGKLKDKHNWYGKYHPIGKNPLNVFPFLEELVYILGDKNISQPMKLSIRRLLYTYAVERKWSTFTSKLVVMQDIKRNPDLNEIVKKYKRLY
jgi:hypothetical protein